ncbi:MAG: NPCBM/NEW2 domain-containing protein [Pirellulales bacterium]
MRSTSAALAAVALLFSPPRAVAEPVERAAASLPDRIELTLRSRDRATGQVSSDKLAIDPRQIGVVLVDTWNFHWCLTATQRCGSFAGRFNQALPAVRQLGMQVFWCPTDVADQYAGTPQRETAVAAAREPLPPSLDIPFAAIHCFESNRCMCGPGIKCLANYGWDGMAPALVMEAGDLMPEGTQELYSLAKQRGITHLIYLGFHTNVCTTGKPVGIRPMANAGLRCILARDMTDAISGYDPASRRHPDGNTDEVIAQIENDVPTIHLGDELKKLGLWPTHQLVDPVRITPWGTPQRPYLFEEPILVSLTAPLTEGAQIHYTLDGGSPTLQSPAYDAPLRIEETTQLRAAAFKAGRQVCLESIGSLVRLSPLPPPPDVQLSEIGTLRATSNGFHAFGSDKKPKNDRNYLGSELRLRGRTYTKGVGVHAPSQLLYECRPEYERFVARCGLDESLIADDLGRAAAMYPSVVFRVLIDGQPVAESPLMRFHHEPWRFDVPIPPGSRTISLVTTDGGNGSRHDVANWVDAGFVLNSSAKE